jgi:hypothetical protein
MQKVEGTCVVNSPQEIWKLITNVYKIVHAVLRSSLESSNTNDVLKNMFGLEQEISI